MPTFTNGNRDQFPRRCAMSFCKRRVRAKLPIFADRKHRQRCAHEIRFWNEVRAKLPTFANGKHGQFPHRCAVRFSNRTVPSQTAYFWTTDRKHARVRVDAVTLCFCNESGSGRVAHFCGRETRPICASLRLQGAFLKDAGSGPRAHLLWTGSAVSLRADAHAECVFTTNRVQAKFPMFADRKRRQFPPRYAQEVCFCSDLGPA